MALCQNAKFIMKVSGYLVIHDWFTEDFKIVLHLFCVCMPVCVCVHASAHLWKSEGNMQNSVLFPHHTVLKRSNLGS